MERALLLFDKVVIGVSANESKEYAATMDERVETIKKVYQDNPRVEVEANNGLTVDFARRHSAGCIIKGARDIHDFLYERQQAAWNRKHGGIDTLLFFAEESLENLSSTAVKRGMHNLQNK